MNIIKHNSSVSELKRRIWPDCDIYYPTLVALKRHRVVCRSNIEEGDDNETEDLDLYDEQNGEQQEADQTFDQLLVQKFLQPTYSTE